MLPSAAQVASSGASFQAALASSLHTQSEAGGKAKPIATAPARASSKPGKTHTDSSDNSAATASQVPASEQRPVAAPVQASGQQSDGSPAGEKDAVDFRALISPGDGPAQAAVAEAQPPSEADGAKQAAATECGKEATEPVAAGDTQIPGTAASQPDAAAALQAMAGLAMPPMQTFAAAGAGFGKGDSAALPGKGTAKSASDAVTAKGSGLSASAASNTATTTAVATNGGSSHGTSLGAQGNQSQGNGSQSSGSPGNGQAAQQHGQQADGSQMQAAMPRPVDASAMAQPTPMHAAVAEGVTGASTSALPQQPVHGAESGSSPLDGDQVSAASGLNTSQIIQNLGQTEMRVGMHSSEFGNISIRTSVSQQEMTAQISLDHAGLGQAIAAHVPTMQTRLGESYGLNTSIQVNHQGASSSGQGNASQGEQRAYAPSARVESAAAAAEPDVGMLSAAAASTGSGQRLDIRA